MNETLAERMAADYAADEAEQLGHFFEAMAALRRAEMIRRDSGAFARRLAARRCDPEKEPCTACPVATEVECARILVGWLG